MKVSHIFNTNLDNINELIFHHNKNLVCVLNGVNEYNKETFTEKSNHPELLDCKVGKVFNPSFTKTLNIEIL